MKKILICILLVVVFSFATGCGLSAPATQAPSAFEEPTEESTFVGGMEFVGYSRGYYEGTNTDAFTYYRDVVTDVMYVCFEEYNKGGMTVMQDPETGLPLTYTRYMELANTPAEES